MVKFEAAVEINRPIDEVFAYLDDPTKTPEWNSLVEESRSSETPVRRGDDDFEQSEVPRPQD